MKNKLKLLMIVLVYVVISFFIGLLIQNKPINFLFILFGPVAFFLYGIAKFWKLWVMCSCIVLPMLLPVVTNTNNITKIIFGIGVIFWLFFGVLAVFMFAA